MKVICLLWILTLALPLAAQQPQAGSDWKRVQAMQVGTPIRVSSQWRMQVCSFESADEDSLTCTEHRTLFFRSIQSRLLYRRAEVSAVKLSRTPLSTLTGAAIGTAAGVGIGAAVDASARSQVEEGHLLAVLGGLFGFGLGAGIGRHSDFLAGPTVYRAP